MEELNNTGVRNLEELRAMRAKLRMEAMEKEAEIKMFFQPVQRVLNFIRGRSHDQSNNGGSSGIVAKMIKIILPLIAGRQIIKHKKKMLLFPILGYFMKEGTEYLMSKNLNEHVRNLKQKLKKHADEVSSS